MTGTTTPPASDIRRAQRVGLVIAMVALAALTNVRLPVRGITEVAQSASSDGIGEFLGRCRRLEPHLPARGQIGYRALSDHARTHSRVKGDRLQLMRYALAPRIIEQFWDHELVIFDAEKGNVVLDLKGKTNSMHKLAFSPDGKHLACPWGDGSVHIYDMKP